MSNSDGTKLSFGEATGIIVGHGVGSGILSVPWLASHNSLPDVLFIALLCYLCNLLLHLVIAELSYNNNGAQFVKCLDTELFKGRIRQVFTWLSFCLIGLSVLVNVSAFLTGAAAVFSGWFGLERHLGMLLFYILCAGVVFVGLKLVGICEKYAVSAMIFVIIIMLAAVLRGSICVFPYHAFSINNALALYGMISFSLSAVMSTPQIVKGLDKDVKKIRGSIAAGLGINLALILLVTVTTLLGAGPAITSDGALVDLAAQLGGWAGIIGYIFTLLALATSFWANTLNLRDIICEQTHWSMTSGWLSVSLPCLFVALFSVTSFVDLTRFASIIQVVTGFGIVYAYALSRRRTGTSDIVGKFGSVPFLFIVVAGTMLASVGAVLKVS